MKRYLCNECSKSFCIDHRQKKDYWIDYIDGLSFRRIAQRTNKKFAQISRIVEKQLNNLIENSYLSSKYSFNWSGVCLIDGKYIRIKGYGKKIPFIYAVDYKTHDIICGVLVASENTEAFFRLFRILKTLNYNVEFLICDNILKNLEYPLKYYFPRAKIQLCQKHYLKNIEDVLNKNNPLDEEFLKDLRKLFKTYERKEDIKEMIRKYGIESEQYTAILLSIYEYRDYLFLFRKEKEVPNTTNLIEGYNSHLEGRLRSLRGFNSFKSAERFLNGWIIRRRTIKFTSCVGKFSFLNGKCPLEHSLNEESLEKIIKDIYKFLT